MEMTSQFSTTLQCSGTSVHGRAKDCCHTLYITVYIQCYHSNRLMWLGVYFAYTCTPHQKCNCCYHSVVCTFSWCICQIYHLLYSVQRFMWVYPLALWALGYCHIILLNSRWYIYLLTMHGSV